MSWVEDLDLVRYLHITRVVNITNCFCCNVYISSGFQKTSMKTKWFINSICKTFTIDFIRLTKNSFLVVKLIKIKQQNIAGQNTTVCRYESKKKKKKNWTDAFSIFMIFWKCSTKESMSKLKRWKKHKKTHVKKFHTQELFTFKNIKDPAVDPVEKSPGWNGLFIITTAILSIVFSIIIIISIIITTIIIIIIIEITIM